MIFFEILLTLFSGFAIWSVVDHYIHPGRDKDVNVHSSADRTSYEASDRSSNLNYVMAVRDSRIWTEVRKRSLTIVAQPTSNVADGQSPADLSDQDLAELKRAYHDALKCVAVDQLLVFKSVTESTGTGSRVTTVRMAIARITKVIAEYTAEHDEKTYRYEEVTETDDASKVDSSVTAIVEDNRELCQIPDGDGGSYAMVRAEHTELLRGTHDANGAVERYLQEYATHVENMYADVFTRFVKSGIEICA